MTAPISEALAKLRQKFTAKLSERLEAIRVHFQSLAPHDWHPNKAEELHRLVHGLTGSAGTFGMQSVSDAARGLETRLAALLS